MAKYDEDLHDNQFFITLTAKYPDLFEQAAENCWVICVPRSESLARMKFHRSDFENHILTPYMGSLNGSSNRRNYFISVNGKHLDINSENITTGEGYKEERHIKILFDELFFNSKDESYQVLCIDQPLEGGLDERSLAVVSLETFEDCKNFLWSDPIAIDKFKKVVDSQLSTFSTQIKLDLTPDQIKESVYHIYDKVLHVVERLPHIKRIQTVSGKQFFLLATETYVLNSLYPAVFRTLCRSELGDLLVNKITRKMCDVCPLDLGINLEYSGNISKARKCLSSLNKCYSPFEKIRCFRETVSTLTKLSRGNSTEALTADQLLPMLVYLVLTSQIPNWKSNLYYMYEFHFSQVGSEEILYYLTSFEAAVEYITSGSLEKNVSSSINRARLPSNGDSLESTRLAKFFEAIYNDDINRLDDILNKLPNDITLTLCHPLCDCTKCAPIIQSYHDNPDHVGVHSHDLLCRTGLHYASLMGHEKIVQKLLENKEFKCDIDSADSNQQTPLHLACLHGNQKCVLYLLSEGANINKFDKQGCTPLHLACSQGQEECVKALVFHKESCIINVANSAGDTPLHYAARWNYISIVMLLLNHGADKNHRNTLEVSPQYSTYNSKIFFALRSSVPSHSVLAATIKEEVDGKEDMSRSRSISVASGASKMSNPKNKRRGSVYMESNNETERQLKKLFRAIHDNDVTMVKYLFGWRDVPSRGEDDDFCHPLCQCEECVKSKKVQTYLTDVNMCDHRGNTPLHTAALHGSRAIVQCLLDHGAARNARTRDELVTPLHLACQYNHKDVVMILLENSVDLNPKDIKGNTPLHFCCGNGHMDSAALLMIHGADVTCCNDRGDTPLHSAARWNHASLVKELILYGAQYSCRNNEDKSPSDLTSDEEVTEVIQKAMKGEIMTGEYAPLPQHANSPGISDDEDFEHL